MSENGGTQRAPFSRPAWLGAATAVLFVIGFVLGLRAIQVERSVQLRYESALSLAQWSLEMHALASILRAGAQADAAALAASDAALIGELKALAARIGALDLSATERVYLARVDGVLDALRASSPIGPTRAAQLERLDAALTGLVTAVRTRTAEAAADAHRASDLARLALVAVAALTLALGGGTLLLLLRSLAEHRRQLGQLSQLAQEDALTKVVNRRGLDERLPVECARAQRLKYPLTVAMLDLDLFKRFNDRRGHAAGDRLLRDAAQAWRRQLRPTDLLARYGGEEFTLVLPACDAEQAVQLIDRLRPLMPERQTFSAGVATWNGEDAPGELLRLADLALLQAKRSGRNRTVVFGHEPQTVLPLKLA